MNGELYLVTKTVPAACTCCKNEGVCLEASSLVTIVARNRNGTVEVRETNGFYVDCDPKVLVPWIH